MNKNITIIGINYYPEESAIGLYTTQKAEYLASLGYQVSVITGFPYYPQWKIKSDYQTKNYLFKETINNVTVYRSKQFVPKDPTFLKRIIHMLSFTFGNFISLFRVPKPNLVISIIPFTTSAFLGWLLKIRYNTKLWIHIQDFEFDAAIDSGLFTGNKKTIIKSLNWVENKILNKADFTSTISHSMLKKLSNKTATKSFYLPNWVDLSTFNKPFNKPHNYLKSNKFKILYSGNIGAKQDWNFFFQFIKAIKNIENIEVIVVGEGAQKETVLKEIKNYKFVSHYDLVPYNELSLLLSSADLHILFQKNNVIDTVMPSKLLGMMASAKPSIITGNLTSEVATIIKESQGGYFLNSNELQNVVKTLQILQNNAILCQKLGENANKYVQTNYSKKNILTKFKNKISQL